MGLHFDTLTIRKALTIASTATFTVPGTTAFTGGLSINGGFTCDTDKFAVADSTGNTTIKATLTVGVDGTGHDVTFFGDTAGKKFLWDQSEDLLSITGHLGLFGADAGFSFGTSGTPITNSTADKKFFSQYARTTATSGDTRNIYTRLYLNGAGVSGEALRNFTTVEAAAATAHGAHSSLSFGASGSVSGLGVGHRATLQGKNANMFATVAGGMSELWADGTSTNWATATEHAIHRFANSGDGTGAATATNVFAFAGLSTGSGKQMHDITVANINEFTKRLRVIVNGVAYHIPMIAA